jgi:hypothetical protein
MANANKPMGLSPHSYLSGAKWNGQATMYYIGSGDSNAYAIGDPVALAGSGDANGVPDVVLATAGASNAVLGAIVGIGGPAGSGTVYGGPIGNAASQFGSVIIPATKTTGYYVLVADDPHILYEVQEGGSSTALATTDCGIMINLKSGTNNGYVSGWLIDNGSKATTSTYQMQLMRLVQRADNAFGAYAKWLVRINNHQFNSGVTGV